MLLKGTLILDHHNDTLLYAGTAKVNITDWFFIKDSITLKYVGLDDAIININRRDSLWNYQFLVDYFVSPKKVNNTTKPITLDLKLAEFNNIHIWKKDNWEGQDMSISLNSGKVSIDTFDLKGQKIRINGVNLDHPSFSQFTYKGFMPLPSLNPASLQPVPPLSTSKPDKWSLAIKNLQVSEGNLNFEKDNLRLAYAGHFDGDHIKFSSINGMFHKVSYSADTLIADVNLSTLERSGFEIKKLKGLLRFTPHILELNNADIITNTSRLKDYVSLHFDDFNKDIANFEHAIILDCNFQSAVINTRDLAFFIPSLKNLKKIFNLSGAIKGTVDNFTVTKLKISSDRTLLDGDITMRGLPDINHTYIDLLSRDLITNYSELATLIPSLRSVTSPKLSALGNIKFRGRFKGLISNFSTSGTIGTDMGTLVTDLNMQLPSNAPTIYFGKLSTTNFRLGKLLPGSQVGNISFNGKISGTGFTGRGLKVALDGFIKNIEYNHYDYQNIVTKGTFKNNLFEGTVSIRDPNLQVDRLSGNINFYGKAPQFNFNAEVSRFNLKNLGLSNKNFSLTGTFDLNFSGNNIDNFLGYARIYNAVLRNEEKRLSFDSLTINSTLEDGKKHLVIQTNELNADVFGKFTILDLPNAFTLFLTRYYPAYITPPHRVIKNQDFTFSIKTKEVQDYVSLISNKLKGFNNSEITGDVNLTANTLNLSARVPEFTYASTRFSDVNVIAKGNFDSLSFTGSVVDVLINDSLHLPDTRIHVNAHNDISDVSIKTSASRTLNEADLSARIQTLTDGFKLNFNPSSFVINEKKWTLEKGGELVLSKTMLSASEVKFVQNDQEIIISTEPSGTGSSNDILIGLKRINMGDILPYFLKDPRMDGLLTGSIRVNDPFGKLNIDFDTREEKFRFENDSVGIVSTSGNYNTSTGDLNFKAKSDNKSYTFLADLAYHSKDSTSNQLNGSVSLDHTDVHILEKYLGSTFSAIHGNATGEVLISGSGRRPKLTGIVKLNDFALTIIYTRCRYFFDANSIITFNPDEIDLGQLKIKDTLNNTATVSGKLYHNFFADFFFNELHFKTDRRNNNVGKFLLLNTTLKDNKQFYGNLIGEADLSLNGPVTDMRMSISGQPTDSSHIYLPTGETAETGKINFLEFLKFGREMKSDLSARTESNIKVDIQITANPYAKIDVILDDVTGDVIKAKGSGKLNITVGSKEPMSIRGRYDILEGQYTFNFQTFLKTPFNLDQGYIEWQGDPYLANLNIDATYRASQVDLSSIPTSKGLSRFKGDVDILFKLRGTLKDPKPDFEFLFTFDNPLRSDPIANEYLKTRFQADKNELNKQVTSLLLFNGFSDQQRLITTNNTVNFATRSLGQMLSSYLSSSLNTWLQKLLNTNSVNLYTNINASDFNFNSGTQQQIQNLGNFGFKTTFLKNRLLINFGGNIDYRLVQSSANANSNFLFTPDVSFEYLISPDGKFRVVGFNKSDADIGDLAGISRRNRTGLLLSYRKDFNTFSEFFGVKK